VSCEDPRPVVSSCCCRLPGATSSLEPRSLLPKLAPAPDFRYVGLELGVTGSLRTWVGLVGTGAILGTTLRGAGGAVFGAGVAVAGVTVARLLSWARARARGSGRPGMAIVPWGVIIESEDRSRILRWPGVTRVRVQAVHGVDLGTPITRYSTVIVETPRERYVGRGPGMLSLDRLMVHLDDYAREASHRIALDLDGSRPGEGPSEPDVELVLSAARAFMATSLAARRLDMEIGGYRDSGVHGATPRATAELSAVLRDRTAREVDPRPFAAVLAAELRATGVTDDLVELVQSPLPLLAAFAKVAAIKLGVARARVGALDEVEPFLLRRDVEALAAWQGT
jgi:hypothetical protein